MRSKLSAWSSIIKLMITSREKRMHIEIIYKGVRMWRTF